MRKNVYLHRHIDQELQAWKDSVIRKPLLVRGARQVGKSSSVRNLGRSFKYFLEVSLEKNPEVASFFKGNRDVRAISQRLSDYFDVPIIPR